MTGKSVLPSSVRAALRASGAGVTCLPVQLDSADWETALFFYLSGPECKRDRQILARSKGPLTVALEGDLLELAQASVVVLRAEVLTLPGDPLAGEVLLTPGGARVHFDTLQLLTQQQRLSWFFADEDFVVIHSQHQPLSVEQRGMLDDLLRDAVRHDALIRASGRYDAVAALAEVRARYALRVGVRRDANEPNGGNA